jgi:hypothetical protein
MYSGNIHPDDIKVILMGFFYITILMLGSSTYLDSTKIVFIFCVRGFRVEKIDAIFNFGLV